MLTQKDVRQNIIEIARAYIGKIPYKYPNKPEEIQTIETGMSCFHFVKFVLFKTGIYTPENYGSIELWENLPATNKPKLADLVFTNGRKQENHFHVGFYDKINEKDMIIDCSYRNRGVAETLLKEFLIKGYRSIE